jgi:hypothetical protein
LKIQEVKVAAAVSQSPGRFGNDHAGHRLAVQAANDRQDAKRGGRFFIFMRHVHPQFNPIAIG